MSKQTDVMEKIVALCRRRGFIFGSSEIYGGIGGFWDGEPVWNSKFTFAFVREQLGKKIGYIENDWNNPDEARSRPKVLYMLYFEPWDWIVSGEVKTGSIIYPNDGIRLRT